MACTPQSILQELWFDVERRYKTIQFLQVCIDIQLWFDVERRYKTILLLPAQCQDRLWFDVERRYKTIPSMLTERSD